MYHSYFYCPLQAIFLTATFVLHEISTIQGQHSNIPQYATLISPCYSGEMQSAGEKWNQDIIPYTFEETLSSDISIAVQQSIYLIESKTCLQYIPHTNQQDYIKIKHNLKCCSHNGRVGYGQHKLYLHDSCASGERLNNLLVSAAAGSVNWELQTTTHECGCGGSVYVDHPSDGSIKSPGYPLDYAKNTQCIWKLWISSGTSIELEVVDFELEEETGCNFDYLEFIKQSEDGRVETTPLKHCGTIKERKYNFTAGSLSLRFVSDMDIQTKGFKIQYKTYSDKTTEKYCSEFNGGCSHQCISDNNGVKQHCSCYTGYALSADGRTCKDIDECSMNKGSCDQKCTNTEGSFYCQCRVGYGLAMNNTTKCNVCGGNLNEVFGEFSSPGYPASFLPLQNCKWKINILPNHFLKVEISNLSIPISKRCVDNYLKVQHGSFSFKKRICGKFSRISYVVKEATGSSSYFRFRTERSNFPDYTGFMLTYQQVIVSQLTQEELDTVYVNDVAIPYATNDWLT